MSTGEHLFKQLFEHNKSLWQALPQLGRKSLKLPYQTLKLAYTYFPCSQNKKIVLKNRVYTRFGKVFQATPGYQEWNKLHSLSAQPVFFGDYARLSIPPDLPLISILIPVYNQLDMTRQCLRSIYESESRSRFEIMIIDDCSTENYFSLLADFPDIRIVRNENNMGYLLSMNQAFSKASGEYIVLLNNDTIVMKGWLDELACALYHHKEAGLIGSALVQIQSNTLQESGNLICKNGDIIQLGRGENPDLLKFCYFRPADYCSAASVILRKSVLVDEMHGFDEIFAPAYYEDSDLALRLKKAGYTNYVMPLSRVLHYGSLSYGNTMEKKGQYNLAIFMNRWKDELARKAVYASGEDFRSGNRQERERVLYLDIAVPCPDIDSASADAVFFMNYMKKRNLDVVFFGASTPTLVPKYSAVLMRMGVECISAAQISFEDYLQKHGGEFQYIFVSRIHQALSFDLLLRRYCPNAAYIFNTVDLYFVREESEAELRDDPVLLQAAAETKKQALALIDRADATIVISRKDKKMLEESYGKKRIWHIPQTREVFGLNRLTERRGAAFIGSSHKQNMDALRYFHDSILPLLPADFHLIIVGDYPKTAIGQSDEYRDLLGCPQYEYVGLVADLRDVLDKVKLTVAPLRCDAGTKENVISSMAYGVPCVSSDFDIKGTGMENGVNILLASTPEEFAEAIRRLNCDSVLWKTISDGGIRLLEEQYSISSVEQKMNDLFKAVRERRSA